MQFKQVMESVATSLIQVIKTKCDVSNENPTKLLNGLNPNEIDDAKNMFEFLEDADNVIDVIDTQSNELNFTIGEEDDTTKLKGDYNYD